MVEEPSKKFAVGDMPPSPTTSNPISNTANAHKKPTRHHVKRRSSGRVHVTKLAPMARAHIQQQSTEDDDNFEDIEQQQQQQQQHAPRKPMKRSHSSKSIHRLSSNDPHRKVNLSGFTMTTKTTTPSSTNNVTHHSPPMTPTEIQPQLKQKQKQKQSTTTTTTTTQPVIDNGSTGEPIVSYTDSGQPTSATPVPPKNSSYQQKSKPLTSPSFQVSHQSPAAPIAHILNATANTLVTPDKPALANLATSNPGSSNDTALNNNGTKAKHLYSRFVDQVDRQDSSMDSIEGRQRQYHKHQQNNHHHQQQSVNDIAYSNLVNLSDTVNKEYQTIQAYDDPMGASLSRCIQQKQQQRRQSTMNRPASTSSQLHLHRLAQMGAQQRTFSSSILPTMASLSLTPPVDAPPTDQRQLARQRHQRLLQSNNISPTNHPYSSSSTTLSSAENKQVGSRWSAGAFLDRVFYGVS